MHPSTFCNSFFESLARAKPRMSTHSWSEYRFSRASIIHAQWLARIRALLVEKSTTTARQPKRGKAVAQLKRTQSETWQDSASQKARPHRRLPRAPLAPTVCARMRARPPAGTAVSRAVTWSKSSAKRSEPAARKQLD